MGDARAQERVLAAFRARDAEALRLALHPYVHWTDAGGVTTRGRVKVLALLADRSELEPPASTEERDRQVYRWTEHRMGPS